MLRIQNVAGREAGCRSERDAANLARLIGFGKAKSMPVGPSKRGAPVRWDWPRSCSLALAVALAITARPHVGLQGCRANDQPLRRRPVNTRRKPRLLALIASTAACLVAYGAQSQEPDPNVPVTARPRPDFDPLGIRAGGFLLFPSVTVDGEYDDNIFASKDNEQDDFIVSFRPRIAARSNFPRHSLNLTVQSDIGRYVSNTNENFEDFGAALAGRLDITRNNRLTATAAVGRDHQTRDDPEDTDTTRKPVEYYLFRSSLGFEQDFNRVNFGLLGNFDRRDYEEEDKNVNEDDRDRNRFGGRLRTGYFISPRINTFLQGGIQREERDASNRTQRDNNVYSIGAGTAIDITGLLFGELDIGWSQQEFYDSRFQSESGLSYGVSLTWNPTQLTSLSLDGDGGFEPSDVGSSNLRSRIALRVDHELLRNVLIGGRIAYRRDDFQAADRVDDRYDVGPDITYLLNRYLSVGAGYTFTSRASDDSNREYTRNLITLRLNAQL
jgi:hypothetical protein